MSTPRPSPTLTLLQAREVVMGFFHPFPNQHGLTEQQWRVIHILCQQDEMESYQLANQACILCPSMAGVLACLERDDIVQRWKAPKNQWRAYVNLTERGQQRFALMNGDMEKSCRHIQGRLGEEELVQLLELLSELKKIKP